MVKKLRTAGATAAHSSAVDFVILASFRGVFGSFPPARQRAMSSSRYAPCSVVVRCVVSAR